MKRLCFHAFMITSTAETCNLCLFPDGFFHIYARPALNIDLSSVILTSAATGGKDPGTVGVGVLEGVDEFSGNDWKLTIFDASRNVFTASVGADATLSVTEGYDSWTVPITYSNAKTGSNKEHVKVKAIFEKIYEAPRPKIEPKGKDKIVLAWFDVSEAKGYDIFMSRCNHGGGL